MVMASASCRSAPITSLFFAAAIFFLVQDCGAHHQKVQELGTYRAPSLRTKENIAAAISSFSISFLILGTEIILIREWKEMDREAKELMFFFLLSFFCSHTMDEITYVCVHKKERKKKERRPGSLCVHTQARSARTAAFLKRTAYWPAYNPTASHQKVKGQGTYCRRIVDRSMTFLFFSFSLLTGPLFLCFCMRPSKRKRMKRKGVCELSVSDWLGLNRTKKKTETEAQSSARALTNVSSFIIWASAAERSPKVSHFMTNAQINDSGTYVLHLEGETATARMRTIQWQSKTGRGLRSPSITHNVSPQWIRAECVFCLYMCSARKFIVTYCVWTRERSDRPLLANQRSRCDHFASGLFTRVPRLISSYVFLLILPGIRTQQIIRQGIWCPVNIKRK